MRVIILNGAMVKEIVVNKLAIMVLLGPQVRRGIQWDLNLQFGRLNYTVPLDTELLNLSINGEFPGFSARFPLTL